MEGNLTWARDSADFLDKEGIQTVVRFTARFRAVYL